MHERYAASSSTMFVRRHFIWPGIVYHFGGTQRMPYVVCQRRKRVYFRMECGECLYSNSFVQPLKRGVFRPSFFPECQNCEHETMGQELLVAFSPVFCCCRCFLIKVEIWRVSTAPSKADPAMTTIKILSPYSKLTFERAPF